MDGKRSKNLLHICIAMDLDNRMEKAWGGGGHRLEGVSEGKRVTYVILKTINIFFKKREKKEFLNFTKMGSHLERFKQSSVMRVN